MASSIIKISDFKYVPSATEKVVIPGLASCTGLVVYREGIKDAYAGHFLLDGAKVADGLDRPPPSFLESLQKAKNKFGNGADVELIVGGASLASELAYNVLAAINPENFTTLAEFHEKQMRNRKYVEEAVNDLGFRPERTRIKWSPDGTTMNLFFDMADGRTDVVIRSFDDRKIIYEGTFENIPGT